LTVRVGLLDYDLPADRIARRPAARRQDARMLVAPRRGAFLDRTIADWVDLVPQGALVVLNDTKVVRARLVGRKEATGGKVELLLVRRVSGDKDAQIWEALGKGLSPFRPGLRMTLGARLRAELERRLGDDGLVRVRLTTSDGTSTADAVEGEGQVPLPPYIAREPGPDDAERYQTVYATAPGAIAAPTAGLHLTHEALAALAARGVRVASLTLHVGLGTFQPVTVDDLDRHTMHAEELHVPLSVVEQIDAARERGGDVIAVGTTVVRALETAADPVYEGRVRAMSGETRLLIQPGFRFRVVDGLLTNFHLPRSTLLALVAALLGTERTLSSYRAAVERGYRFYSYGDAMWIPIRARSSP
jgi:S-adenosylmethionine:tRNA ribosyltransferase-isomerase